MRINISTANRRGFLTGSLAATLALVLGGCGQKGSLYLPESAEDDKKKPKTSSLGTGRDRVRG